MSVEIISGAKLGVLKLRQLIQDKDHVTLKQELGLKGSPETIIAKAKAILANVANW